MNQISIEDTIFILSRVASMEKAAITELTLVGGQALNFWADRYFGKSGDFVSGDIDFLGSAATAFQCAEAWETQKIHLADLDSGMGSPNTAVILIEYNGKPLEIDFLGNIIGPSVREVLKDRCPVLAKEGFTFHVMHPVHVMESRIANACYLGRKDEISFDRIELSFAVVRQNIDDLFSVNTRMALNITERIIDIALSDNGLKIWSLGKDPLSAIPDARKFPTAFQEKRWPQVQKDVDAKRNSYLREMSRIREYFAQKKLRTLIGEFEKIAVEIQNHPSMQFLKEDLPEKTKQFYTEAAINNNADIARHLKKSREIFSEILDLSPGTELLSKLQDLITPLPDCRQKTEMQTAMQFSGSRLPRL